MISIYKKQNSKTPIFVINKDHAINKDSVINEDNYDEVLFSVCIPVYNGMKTIQKCIDSILNQSLQNFEIIIVDDSSTDKTQEIILNNKDKRIFYYRNQKQMGSFYARSLAMHKAKGKYVIPIDADDTIVKNAFDALNKIFKSDNEIGIIQFNIKCIANEVYDENSLRYKNTINYFNTYTVDHFDSVDDMMSYSLSQRKNRNVITKCFRRSCILNAINIAFNEYAEKYPISMYDDFLFLCILMVYGNIKKIIVLPFYLYMYCLGGQSTSKITYCDRDHENSKMLINGLNQILSKYNNLKNKNEIYQFVISDLQYKIDYVNLEFDVKIKYLSDIYSYVLKGLKQNHDI